MKKTNIERIIKQGSTKQKIKLYFTDIAHFNTVGNLLTDKERDIIFNSIKEPKDIKHWEELRTWNKVFLMFKPIISTYTKSFDYLNSEIRRVTHNILLHKSYQYIINDIIKTFDGLTLEDEKLRERLIKKTLESFKAHPFDAKKADPPGYLKSIVIPQTYNVGELVKSIEFLNEKIIDAKEFIKGIETFLSKNLPLQPYKQFLKDEEDKIKTNIEKCKEWVEITHKIEGELQDDERYKILNWDEVEVEVTDEDIEDIKRAGL